MCTIQLVTGNYSLLAFRLRGGGILARAKSKCEWESNRIAFSTTNFVFRVGESMVENILIASGNIICAF